ncbi:hypothetical protein [Streptomyces sp. LN549]|uniref:hypothetical protein n=1 Tax=Streptomyces sp. LN549 TaxID=3112979 RepID=UPI00371ABDA5
MQSLITDIHEHADAARFLAWPGDFDLDRGDHGEDVHLASCPFTGPPVPPVRLAVRPQACDRSHEEFSKVLLEVLDRRAAGAVALVRG